MKQQYLYFPIVLITLISLLISCDSAVQVSSKVDQGADIIKPDPKNQLDISIFEAFIPEADLTMNHNPCDPSPCASDEQCEVAQGVTVCTKKTCQSFSCGENEECIDSETGPSCRSLLCQNDADCALEEFCDQERCQPDACIADQMRCEGFDIWKCSFNGAREELTSSCDPLRSACVSVDPTNAYCSCSDDWDCPNYLVCENGLCLGTPREAQCKLPVVSFTESLPQPEFVWGGAIPAPAAVGSPFSKSVQVVMTPLVSFLADDNNDGRIDENDFPKILFISFCNSEYDNNGLLRAIHGGGPKKGKDYFATLGNERWVEGLDMPQVNNCAQGNINPTAPLAVGNLDDINQPSFYTPEIVAIHESNGILIYDHQGQLILEALVGDIDLQGANPSLAIANIDGEGMAEIIVGSHVISLMRDENDQLKVVGLFTGELGTGTNGQGPISCVANVLADAQLEVIAGSSVYRMPKKPLGANTQADCQSNGGAVMPADEEEIKWCTKKLITVWDARMVNGVSAKREGFCAIADVLGVDQELQPSPTNPLDQLPEVILISEGRLQIFNGQNGTMKRNIVISANDRGGAPNVDDFDGDGFPEIGSAFASQFVMMDLQEPTVNCPEWPTKLNDTQSSQANPELAPPRNPGPAQCVRNEDCQMGEGVCMSGKCICLHNGWKRKTEDDSSKVTGSTLFDFNGDGATEVIYNDECWFRIYDGLTGTILLKEPSESRTRIENPLVADVDNDGNAEIIFSTSTESEFCSERSERAPDGTQWKTKYNAGIEVWGDPNDQWVSARRTWNQHAYHITNVTENVQIPSFEPEGWISQNGRFYNSYRSQPRNYNLAPDLTIDLLSYQHVSGCQTNDLQANVSLTLINQGDARVGAGIVLNYYGKWNDRSDWTPLKNQQNENISQITQQVINPAQTVRLDLIYDAALDPQSNGQLPLAIMVKADDISDSAFGAQRECFEDNNQKEADLIVTGTPLADLLLSIVEASSAYCDTVSLKLAIKNEGTANTLASELALYVGDPSTGGFRFSSMAIPAIPSGLEHTVDWLIEGLPYRYGEALSIYIVADPQNSISECDETDNKIQWQISTDCRIRD